MQYRREIDGLRALAVIPVILFHAGVPGFSGGFVGVDVFFVVSGYLITGLLVGDLEAGRFSIVEFYQRRARRILPALIVVTLACLPFAWAWMMPQDFVAFGKSLIAAGLFYSNVHFWLEAGYFERSAELKPLLHTWSLAVEEQFYLLFPLVLCAIWRFGKSRVFTILAGVAILSLAFSEWHGRFHPEANFYLLHTRAWELLAGSMAALFVRSRGIGEADLPAMTGLLCIVFAVFALDETVRFPGVAGLLPVGGTVALLVWGGAGTVVARVLSHPLPVALGLVSYSAYLWHQPLFAFARLRLPGEPDTHLTLALIATTFVLAGLTWRFVEQPFRRRGPVLARPISLFAASAAGLSALVAIGLAVLHGAGFPGRVPPEAYAQAHYSIDANPYRDACLLREGDAVTGHPISGCDSFLNEGRADVVLLGDSHSDAISHQVQVALAKTGISSYAVAYSGCLGLEGFHRVDRGAPHTCGEYSLAMTDYAKSQNALVVLTARLPLYIDGRRFNNGVGGIEHGGPAWIDVAGKQGGADNADRQHRVAAALGPAIAALADKVPLIVIDPIPEIGWDVPAALARCTMFGEACDLSLPVGRFRERAGAVTAILDRVNHGRITRVSPQTVLCDEIACAAVRDGKPLYSDDDHLAESTGAVLLAPLVVAAIKERLRGE